MIKKNSGFSLVEIMVVVGIMSIVGYFAKDLFHSLVNGQKVTEQKINFVDFSNGIESAIIPEKCSLVMKNNSNAVIALALPNNLTTGTNLLTGSAKINITALYKGSTLITSVDASVEKGLKVTSIWLEDAVYDGEQIQVDRSTSPATESTLKVFISTLYIQLTLSPSGTKQIVYPIRLKTDSLGNVLSCGNVNFRTATEQLEKSLEQTCTNLGWTYNASLTPKCHQ